MKKILMVLMGFLILGNMNAQDIYFHSGKLVDTKKGKVLEEKTIVVSENKIKEVLDGYVQPGGASDVTVDLKNRTVLPGLTDMHVHLESETNPNKYLERFTNNEADAAFNAVGFAETTLGRIYHCKGAWGSGVNISLRNAINKGKVPGPRIFTTGKSIATTGGHADPTSGMNRELVGDPGPKRKGIRISRSGPCPR